MIKTHLPKGQIEIVIGDRFAVEGDPFKFEAHIYLRRGEEMHGGIGKTVPEAILEAVKNWGIYEDGAKARAEREEMVPTLAT